MKQRRLRNGKYRINYFDRLFPLYLMLLTAGLSWGLQTGNKLRIQQVQARGGDNASWVELANATTPTPTPQLRVIAPTPVIPTATPTPTDKEEIIAEIVRVFGEEAPNAFNVLYCENRGLNPEAVNWNSNGSWDAGIFQVNQIHGYTMDQMKDYKQNIRAAKKIFDGRGWTAWACSERVDIKPFWKE